MKMKFKDRDLERLAADTKDRYYTDVNVPGLVFKVSAKDHRTFVFQRWLNGRNVKTTLGIFKPGTFGIDEARRAVENLRRLDSLSGSEPPVAPAPKPPRDPGADPEPDEPEARPSASARLEPEDQAVSIWMDGTGTVAAAMREYFAERQTYWSPRTAENAAPLWRRIIAAFEATPLPEISKRDFEQFLAREPNLKIRKRLRVQIAAFARWHMEKNDFAVNIVPNPIRASTRAEKLAMRVRNERFLGLGELSRILKLLMLMRSPTDRRHSGFTLFLLATGLRLSEAADLHLSEFAPDRRSLTVPETRMKVGGAHEVHLSRMAERGLEIAEAPKAGKTIWGFDPAGNISAWRRANLERIADAPFVQHDFRRTLPTHLTDLGVMPHVCDAILAHQISGGGVTNIYNRSQVKLERQAALDLWSDVLEWLLEINEELPDVFDADLAERFKAWREARSAVAAE